MVNVEWRWNRYFINCDGYFYGYLKYYTPASTSLCRDKKGLKARLDVGDRTNSLLRGGGFARSEINHNGSLVFLNRIAGEIHPGKYIDVFLPLNSGR